MRSIGRRPTIGFGPGGSRSSAGTFRVVADDDAHAEDGEEVAAPRVDRGALPVGALGLVDRERVAVSRGHVGRPVDDGLEQLAE